MKMVLMTREREKRQNHAMNGVLMTRESGKKEESRHEDGAHDARERKKGGIAL